MIMLLIAVLLPCEIFFFLLGGDFLWRGVTVLWFPPQCRDFTWSTVVRVPFIEFYPTFCVCVCFENASNTKAGAFPRPQSDPDALQRSQKCCRAEKKRHGRENKRCLDQPYDGEPFPCFSNAFFSKYACVLLYKTHSNKTVKYSCLSLKKKNWELPGVLLFAYVDPVLPFPAGGSFSSAGSCQ